MWALVGCENPGQAWKVPEVSKGDGYAKITADLAPTSEKSVQDRPSTGKSWTQLHARGCQGSVVFVANPKKILDLYIPRLSPALATGYLFSRAFRVLHFSRAFRVLQFSRACRPLHVFLPLLPITATSAGNSKTNLQKFLKNWYQINGVTLVNLNKRNTIN